MVNIHSNFVGGNIRVLKKQDADIYLQIDLRDTQADWFYWAFCVEGAQGKTLTFHFQRKWVGYYGPAVSHNLKTWNWQNEAEKSDASDSFTYTFGEKEDCVYFAHDILYHPEHFGKFCKENGMTILPLCTSEAGKQVPYVCFGSGEETILLTARHHACESSGNYVLEGVLEELHFNNIPGFKVIAIPFVDYDGVVKGDQGKERKPWDHNRDYDCDKESIYTTTKEIRRIAGEEMVRYAFDFHAPWHCWEMNDLVYIVCKSHETYNKIVRFANLLEENITGESLGFEAKNVLAPDCGWNVADMPTFCNYMQRMGGTEISFSLETPYFYGTDKAFSPSGARELGKCFVRALREYHSFMTAESSCDGTKG